MKKLLLVSLLLIGSLSIKAQSNNLDSLIINNIYANATHKWTAQIEQNVLLIMADSIAAAFHHGAGSGTVTSIATGFGITGGTITTTGTLKADTSKVSTVFGLHDSLLLFKGSTNINTVGTIGSGTWHGGLIGSTYGGTGVNNGSRTITTTLNNVTIPYDSSLVKYGTLECSSTSEPTFFSVAPGASTYVWTSNGTSSYPSWQASAGGGGSDSGCAGSSSITVTAAKPRVFSIKSTWVDPNAWSLTGNAGTTAGTNYIGTSDSVPFVFKVNAKQAGKIDVNLKNTSFGYKSSFLNTTGIHNTSYGAFSLYAITTGTGNTTTGYKTGYATTTGDYNVFIGDSSGYSNTTGGSNLAMGYNSLGSNTTGMSNTAIGYNALSINTIHGENVGIGGNAFTNNTTGDSGVAIGYAAGNTNSSGVGNTNIGFKAGYTNSTSAYNVAIGFDAMYNNTATSNVGIGLQALFTNSSGTANTAIGRVALFTSTGSNQTGVGDGVMYSNSTGANNTAVGASASQTNTTGKNNTSEGWNALFANSSATGNTATGSYAGKANTGSFNVFDGDSAGIANTTGTNNTFIGYKATANGAAYTNATALGNGATVTASNTIMHGNSSVTRQDMNGGVMGIGTAPSLSAGVGAGTSPTVSDTGTNLSGEIVVTTGTLPTGTNAVIVTGTFANSLSFTNGSSVVLYPANANTGTLNGVSMVFVNSSKNQFVITSGTTALTAATTYAWKYVITGY